MGGKAGGERLGLLVISNLYPPLHVGGYELGCADIVAALRARGHDVTVLTSRHGLQAPRTDGQVHRRLAFRPDSVRGSLATVLRREREDQRALQAMIAAIDPDLVYVFSLYGVSAALPLIAQRAGRRVAYAFSAEWLEPGYRGDAWLGFWSHEASTGPRRALKRALRRSVDPFMPTGLDRLDLRRAYFTSRRLRELFAAKGFRVEQADVIHWGVDVDRFRPRERADQADALRLLFAGRIAEEKGLHTVIEALALLPNDAHTRRHCLTVAGPAQDDAYLASLRRRIEQGGLGVEVRWVGPVAREAMPDLYRAHDVFLLPSIWEEPFSIGLLEAMASGLAVIGTATGGSAEILRDRENGLVFAADDAKALADRLRLVWREDVRSRLGEAARRTVETGFRFETMLERIESFLTAAAGRRNG